MTDERAEVDVRVDRLCELLDRAAEGLRAQNEERWARWLAGDARLIREGDARGLEHFLSAFGGMGSLADRLASDAESAILHEAYEIAAGLPREVNRPDIG